MDKNSNIYCRHGDSQKKKKKVLLILHSAAFSTHVNTGQFPHKHICGLFVVVVVVLHYTKIYWAFCCCCCCFALYKKILCDSVK